MNGYGKLGMADYPKSEFERRWKKTNELMHEGKIDFLFLSHWANVAYFSGFRQTYTTDVSYVFVLPRDEDPVLVVPLEMKGNIEAMTWMSDVRYYGGDVLGWKDRYTQPDPAHIIRQLFEKHGGQQKTVGVELEGIGGGGGMINYAPQVLDAVRNKVPGLSFVNCADLVWKMRKIKSPVELDYARKAAEITTKAFKAGLESLREGVTERDFARVVYKTMLDEGATDTPLVTSLMCRSDRYTHDDSRPTDRKIRGGEIVNLDGGAAYRGYWCDMSRQACVGKPSKKQSELYDIARRATEAGIEAVKPGVTAHEVCEAAFDVVRKAGFGENVISPGIGHALGLQVHEPPWISYNIHEKLEPGMILAIEPTIYDMPIADYLRGKISSAEAGEAVFTVEDNLVVTESGHEVITPMSRELWIAP
jgi:Xaa-Pro aminopeptidase